MRTIYKWSMQKSADICFVQGLQHTPNWPPSSPSHWTLQKEYVVPISIWYLTALLIDYFYPASQIWPVWIHRTGQVVAVPKYQHFCRKKVISAEILMFLPKEGCFCISAETDFWTESLFRHVDQKKIRPNYSAESLFGRTLPDIERKITAGWH